MKHELRNENCQTARAVIVPMMDIATVTVIVTAIDMATIMTIVWTIAMAMAIVIASNNNPTLQGNAK